MALSLRHGSQGGGRAYALVTMDARGLIYLVDRIRGVDVIETSLQ